MFTSGLAHALVATNIGQGVRETLDDHLTLGHGVLLHRSVPDDVGRAARAAAARTERSIVRTCDDLAPPGHTCLLPAVWLFTCCSVENRVAATANAILTT